MNYFQLFQISLFFMFSFIIGFCSGRLSLRKDIEKLVSQKYDAEVRKDTMKYLAKFELIMVKKEEDP